MSNPVTVARPGHIPGMETYREKAVRKFKENPWVPLGSLATVGALVTAMVKLKRGQSHSFNTWLRVRVAAQGLTIVAIVAGTYSLRPKSPPTDEAADPTLTRNDVDVERRRLEKIAREKGEFEERLKEAEDATRAETELRANLLSKKSAQTGSASEPTEAKAAGSSAGWTSWFGWGKPSTSVTPTPPAPSTPSSTQTGADPNAKP